MGDRRSERLDAIAQVLTGQESVHLRDAAKMLGVSEMTVRRDLAAVPEKFNYYGGHILAQSSEGGAPGYVFDRESESHIAAKRRACEAALGLIEPGDTIFIDCGTTMPHLVRGLAGLKNITVVCYALNVAELVRRIDTVELVLLGGVYRRSSASFESAEALETFKRIGINAAFVSAGGVHPDHGVTCSNFHEVPFKQEAIRSSVRRYLVVDQSKFGRVRSAWFASVDAFDAVVSDGPIPEGMPAIGR